VEEEHGDDGDMTDRHAELRCRGLRMPPHDMLFIVHLASNHKTRHLEGFSVLVRER
jgi:hypothetical protein